MTRKRQVKRMVKKLRKAGLKNNLWKTAKAVVNGDWTTAWELLKNNEKLNLSQKDVWCTSCDTWHTHITLRDRKKSQSLLIRSVFPTSKFSSKSSINVLSQSLLIRSVFPTQNSI